MSIKKGNEYVHPFVCLMMMLLFGFLSLRASLSATLLFDLLFDLHRVSNPFLANKCSLQQQFKILSTRLKDLLLQVLHKFHNRKLSESQRVSQIMNWTSLTQKKYTIHWKMPSINQITSTIRFTCSLLSSYFFRPVVQYFQKSFECF